MGTHGTPRQKILLPPFAELKQITFHIWPVADKTMIQCTGVYGDPPDVLRRNLGADVLDYSVFQLPHLHQAVYAIGDEIRAGWRELSTPKS